MRAVGAKITRSVKKSEKGGSKANRLTGHLRNDLQILCYVGQSCSTSGGLGVEGGVGETVKGDVESGILLKLRAIRRIR